MATAHQPQARVQQLANHLGVSRLIAFISTSRHCATFPTFSQDAPPPCRRQSCFSPARH
jgi:hypothetical protein